VWEDDEFFVGLLKLLLGKGKGFVIFNAGRVNFCYMCKYACFCCGAETSRWMLQDWEHL
jgi:hypothetical protein